MNHLINDLLMSLNNIGRIFCGYAASMFIQSSLLIVILFVTDLLLRRKVRAIFRYCVWLLVLVKLILPPTLSLPTGIGYWAPDRLPEVSSHTFDLDEPEVISTPVERSFIQPSESIVEHAPSVVTVNEPLTTLSWQAVLFILWLVGVSAFSLVLAQRMRFVRGLVTRSNSASEEMLGVLEQYRLQMSVRCQVRLRLSEAVSSPAVCGLLKPVVLMPADLVEKLSPEGLRATLIHELAHIKRGDLWVNAFQTALQVVYFYNPFVWFANSVIRKVCEEAVDETVLVALGGKAKDYSNTLIDISEMAFWKIDLGLRLIGVAESKKALQWRIRHMLTRPIPKSAKIGAFSTITILLIAAILLPMAKAQNSPKTSAPSTAKLEEESDDSRSNADRIFGKPTNLGSPVNSFADEYGPSISADELELYFNSNLPSGLGRADIWMTTRRTKADPWGKPVTLGTTVNSSFREGGPSISGDGLSLYFSSDRPGGHGCYDLWLVTRKTKSAPWTEPVNLGSTVNSSADEHAPSISSDGLELYFAGVVFPIGQARPGGIGEADLWVTTRKTTSGPWGEPVNLGPIVNSSFGDGTPSISGDGLSLYFDSSRPSESGVGSIQIWVTKRKSKSDPWGTPVNLGPAVNAYFEASPDISKDGSTLYFHSRRPGGIGGADIWQATLEQGSEETPESIAQSESDTSLYEAVKTGDIEQVRSHLSKGAGVNAKDKEGRTPLHWAAYYGRREAAQVLIAKGANVNEADASGQTPLHLAANFGGKFVPEQLLAKGADINARDIAGNTPLHIAAGDFFVEGTFLEFLILKGADVKASNEAGQTPLHLVSKRRRLDKHPELAAEVLLSHGSEVGAKDKSGYTPLHFAAENGLRLVELLLAKGADIEARAADGATPLHRAATRGRSDVVELLLEQGVDINAKTVNGETPAQLAALGNRKDTVKLLLSKGAEVSTIQLAAYVGDLAKVKRFVEQGVRASTPEEYWPALQAAATGGQREVAEFLISKGVSVNSPTAARDRVTPLYLAAYEGSTEVAELLLSKGAEIDARDTLGFTALHGAAMVGEAEMVRLLIAHGADLNAKTLYDKTPLYYAASSDSDEVVKLLIDKGAIISKDDGLLYFACIHGHKELAEALIKKGANVNPKSWGNAISLEIIWSGFTDLPQKVDRPRLLAILALLFDNGADPNAKERWGWSLLHYACFHADGETDLTSFLLDRGANPNATDAEGGTPLRYVADKGDRAVAQLLISRGANVNAKDYYGRTPLSYAEDLGDKDQWGDPKSTPLTTEAKSAKKEVAELLRKHGATE